MRKELKLSNINRITPVEVTGYGTDLDNDSEHAQVEWNDTTVIHTIFALLNL
jgi:hypothetical protein